MSSLPESFVAALEMDRESLNARYARRIRSGATIDGEAFLQHLEQSVAPLITRVSERFPGRTRLVLSALYDVSLDLFTASLLGPEARTPWVQLIWNELLPSVTQLLAKDPAAVAGSLCNAIVQISQQTGARPEQWIDQMKKHIAECANKTELLKLGVFFAWQAGMVQYRTAALKAVRELGVPLAATVLHLPTSADRSQIDAQTQKLARNIWLKNETTSPLSGVRQLAAVARVGAFSGFGGLFQRPPTVTCHSGCLMVSDGTSQWELLADAHGAWFRKTGEAPTPAALPARPPSASIDQKGKVTWQECSLMQPQLQEVTSVAACDHTLAVTIATSHHLFLYALVGGEDA